MRKNYYLPYLQICIISILFASCSQVEPESVSEQQGEWRHAGGDHSSAKYAALDQIDSSNFSELQLAWSWQSADLRLPEGVGYGTADYRAVPLVVNGRMYTNTRTTEWWRLWTQSRARNYGYLIRRVTGTGHLSRRIL